MTTQANNFLPFVKIDHIIQRLYTTPLVGEFGGVIPLSYPVGKLFFLSREAQIKYDGTDADENQTIQKDFSNPVEGGNLSTYKFKILASNMDMRTERIKSVWTQEALHDYNQLFKEKPEDEVSKTIAAEITNECVFQLDQKFIHEISKVSTQIDSNLDFKKYDSKLDLAFTLVDMIYENALEMIGRLNNKSGVSVFASLPICSALMAHPNYKFHQKIDGTFDEENVYFMGSINNIKIFCDLYGFLNDTHKNDTKGGSMIIGVKDLMNEANSSVVFSPYKVNLTNEVNPNSGEYELFVFYSYGITISPQHDKDNSTMIKQIQFKNSKN